MAYSVVVVTSVCRTGTSVVVVVTEVDTVDVAVTILVVFVWSTEEQYGPKIKLTPPRNLLAAEHAGGVVIITAFLILVL